MGIFRGIGGTGNSTDDGVVDAVTEQAVLATNKATEAANSASSASASATDASNSATSASTSATTATTKASEASNSATSAATSATSAATSATSATASATTATTKASEAATSATNAATSETNAATSATTATTKASEAATSATTATTKAGEASTSATNAASSATSASTSASTATTKASEASTSAASAASSYDSFDDRYLGAKSSAPSVDNDGDALITGALYFDTTSDSMKVYSGSSWLDAYASLSGALLATNNLSDLNNVSTARTNLGLGTAATTASTDYATAAQGTKADTAHGWGNHASAGYLTGNQTITLSGDVSGSGTTSISVTVADDSHNHVISNVDGLQTALDAKLASSSYTAADVLTKIKTVDGSGSGLDADTLDGVQATGFLQTSGGTLTGNLTVPTLYINDTNTSISEGSADSIRLTTDDGYVDIGAMNSGYCHFQTDRTNFYFDKPIHADGQIYNYASGGTTQPYWHAGNDGSGSGLDADLLDGYNSAENGASTIHRLASNGYSQIQNWINVANAGLYSTTQNSAHWRPNATGSYGAWRIDGSRGGYSGIYHGDGGGAISGMFDSSGNGGDWNVSTGWHYYYHRSNDCLAISGSGTSSAYEAYVHGDLYATGNVTAYSDARIKENVETIDSALDKVESLRGVYYNKIDDPDKTKEIGFIAQEVNEVIPEAVTYAKDVDQYGVKYANITALLVESVKELSQQVKDLQAEIKELKENV